MLKNLLATPTERLGKAGRFVVFQIKLWSHCARLLRRERCGQQAAALSYHTIFGLVPLIIVMLLIFTAFPAYSDIAETIKDFVYDQANLTAFQSAEASQSAQGRLTAEDTGETTVALTEHLDKIVAGFFTSANTGYITLLGVVFVIWAALALLSTIEKAFNNIWHVSRGRSFLHRMINYWALLTLGPLLLGVGIYISTRYSAIGQIQKTVVSNAAPIVVSFLVAGIAFFLLYFVLPNTKVQAKSAIWGAAVAALVWVAAKGLFGYSVTELKMYRTVYGTLALFPITILWIYITWLIVLFGLQLTFTTQHLKTLDTAEITKAKKTEEYFIANDVTVINIVREIAKAFEEDKAPISSYGLFSSLDMPVEFGEKIIERLVKGGIIAKVSEPREGFIPVKEPAKIRLSEVAEVVASACFGQSKAGQNKNVRQIALSVKGLLAEYNLQQILSGEENPVRDTLRRSNT